MKWFSKHDHKTPAPEEVPADQLSTLSKQYINWKSATVFGVGAILVVGFAHTLATNASINAFATAADTGEPSRFAGMISLLVVIFAFAALALFLWKKLQKK